jgi:phosphate transport system substrate-binding protein
MNRLQSTAHALLLATILASAGSFGAGLPGDSAKSAPRASGKISGKLIISGPSTMAPMIGEIARRFEALHPGTQVEIQDSSAAAGLSDVRQGKTAIAMLTRALTDKESDLTSYPVARDGVCIIVHKDNPVKLLTSPQVVNAYTGRIVNWNRLGGSDAAIDVVIGEQSGSALDALARYFGIKYDEIRPRAVLRSSSDRIKTVAENRNAISYVSIGEAERNMRAGVPIKMLPAEGVLATARTLRSGNYPIARSLTLITSGTENELAREFIRYTLSPGVTGIIVKYDFVPYQD